MLITLLSKLRVLDEQGNLSLTNMGIMVLIAKIALANPLDWPTTAALMLALLNYGHKRIEASKATSATLQSNTEVAELAAKVDDLKTLVNLKRL